MSSHHNDCLAKLVAVGDYSDYEGVAEFYDETIKPEPSWVNIPSFPHTNFAEHSTIYYNQAFLFFFDNLIQPQGAAAGRQALHEQQDPLAWILIGLDQRDEFPEKLHSRVHLLIIQFSTLWPTRIFYSLTQNFPIRRKFDEHSILEFGANDLGVAICVWICPVNYLE